MHRDGRHYLLLIDFQSCIRQAGPTGGQLLGYDLETLAGRSLSEMVAMEDRNQFLAFMQGLPPVAGATRRRTLRLLGADGTHRWVKMALIRPLSDIRNQFLIADILEVGAGAAAEAALERSENRYRALFDSNPQPSWVFDVRTLRFLAVNRAAQRLYGYSEAEFLKMTVKDIRPAEDIPTLTRQLSAALARARVSVARHIKKNGEIIHVQANSDSIIFDGIPGRLVVIEDLTGQYAAERARVESEQRFQLAARATNDIIWDWDIGQDTLWMSEAYNAQLGYGAGEVGGRLETWSAHIHPDDRDRILESVQSLLASQENSWRQEYRLHRADGTYATILDRGCVLRLDGQAVRMVGSMLDISQRKLTEEELRAVLTNSQCILWRANVSSAQQAAGGSAAEHGGEGAEYHWEISVQDEHAAQQVLPLALRDGQSYTERWLASCHSQDFAAGRALFNQCIAEGARRCSREYRCTDKNGREVWLHEEATIVPLKDGHWQLFGVATDISERKLAEQRLLRAKDELEAGVATRTTALQEANRSLLQEVEERKRAEEESQSRVRQQQAMADLGCLALEASDMDELCGRAIELLAGTVHSDVCAIYELIYPEPPQGVAEERPKEEAPKERLKEAKLLLRSAVGVPADIIGKATISTEPNSPAGYTLHTGEPVIVPNLREEKRFKPAALSLAQGVVSSVNVLIGGTERPYGVICVGTTTPREFTAKDVTFLQGMSSLLALAIGRQMRNTSIRELNTELQQANEKLRIEIIERKMFLGTLQETARSLDLARAEAEKASQSKNDFLSRMSHELRTPLNAILGFGQLLSYRQLSERDQEAVQYILKAGHHLLELINEVLDISRIEAGKMAISPEPVLLETAVLDAVDLLRTLAQSRGVTVTTDFSGHGAAYVRADQQKLRQVLMNLIANAIKYNRQGGDVRISSESFQALAPGASNSALREHLELQTRMRLTVADTGPGLTAEEIGKLFVPFERLRAQESGVEGTGIGLALSKRLMEAMGGSIGVDSQPGVGSWFWIDLPEVPGPLETLRPVPAMGGASGLAVVEEDGEQSPEAGSAYRVLCVEDNLSNLHLIQSVLVDRRDIVLLSATQGAPALDMARDHQPHLILLDLHLPDIDGEEVLLRLRRDPATANIPVVILSADATPRQIDRLMAAGARHYLTKPLDLNLFLEVVSQILSES